MMEHWTRYFLISRRDLTLKSFNTVLLYLTICSLQSSLTRPSLSLPGLNVLSSSRWSKNLTNSWRCSCYKRQETSTGTILVLLFTSTQASSSHVQINHKNIWQATSWPQKGLTNYNLTSQFTIFNRKGCVHVDIIFGNMFIWLSRLIIL